MKILVNAVAGKSGGWVEYIGSLLRELAIDSRGGRWFFLVSSDLYDLLKVDMSNSPDSPVKVIIVPISRGWKGFIWSQICVSRIIRRYKIDVLFSAGNMACFLTRVPQVLRATNALFDSEVYRDHYLSRYNFVSRLSFIARRIVYHASCMFVDIIHVPSNALADDLVRSCSLVPRSKIRKIQYGISYSSYGRHGNNIQSMSESYRPNKIRILDTSWYCDYKNMITVFKALAILAEEEEFVFITTADPRHDYGILNSFREEELATVLPLVNSGKVCLLHQPDKATILREYERADIFVTASVAEACSYTVLEAMASGCVIVAADTPVNREICGDAAAYFAPFSSEELADCFLRLMDSISLRKELMCRSLKRSELYTWQSYVDGVSEVCMEAFSFTGNHS